jgi:CubicO group peptidase (beta-lactamase class C family)
VTDRSIDKDRAIAGALKGNIPPASEPGATLANWRQPPFNRWSFRNVRQIVPSAAISRAAIPSRMAGHGGRPIDRIAFHGPDGAEWTIGSMLRSSFCDGFLVLRRGRIVAEWYDGGLRPETPYILFSVSKSLTGTLSGVLVEQGRLDPEAPVTRYIPEAAASAYGDCTVRHVLDMSVAIDFTEDYQETGDFARYRVATGWNPGSGEATALDLRSFLITLKRARHPHGSAFHYVSPNSDLLGWILERASGMPYAQLMTEALWRPMGAEFDAYVTVDRLGAARAAGGICASLRDLGRFGELMRGRGLVDGRQVLPGWWIDDILTNGDPAIWHRSDMARLMPDGRYRSKWYVTGNERGAYAAAGIHGQWIYVDPAAEMVAVRLASQPLAVDEPTDRLVLAAFDALGRALTS